MIETILDEQHWMFEDYKQRMPTKKWKQVLLNKEDHIFFHGRGRTIVGKNLGAGVYEVYKEAYRD